MPPKKGKLSFMLESWQTRMVQDFTGIEFRHAGVIEIDPGVITCPASYKIPPDGISKKDWILYLTTDQMKQIRKFYRTKELITGINITDELIKKGAVIFNSEIIKLKLEKWQAIMARDMIEKQLNPKYMLIKHGIIKCPASYKIPVHGLTPRDWLMYLTDEQMGLVKDAFDLKEAVSSLNITDKHIKEHAVMFM